MSPKDIADLAERKRGWPLIGYAPGNYFCKCHICDEQFEGDKRAFHCLPCALNRAHESLDRLAVLEVEVQAAKDFGGGFYGDVVQEKTRQFYRDDVKKRQSDALLTSIGANHAQG
jgi:hypothetical protein